MHSATALFRQDRLSRSLHARPAASSRRSRYRNRRLEANRAGSRSVFDKLPPAQQQRFLEWIDTGPNAKRYIASRRKMDSHTPDEEDVVRYENIWTRDHLGIIADRLPSHYNNRFEALVAEFGPARKPGPLFRVSGGLVREPSPLSEEETLLIPPQRTRFASAVITRTRPR